MDPILLLGGIVAVMAALWPAYQLIDRVFSKFAKKADLDALEERLGDMDMVTRREYEHHNNTVETATRMRDATVNRVLDIHEKAISDHLKADVEMHAKMMETLSDISADVAFIKGRTAQ